MVNVVAPKGDRRLGSPALLVALRRGKMAGLSASKPHHRVRSQGVSGSDDALTGLVAVDDRTVDQPLDACAQAVLGCPDTEAPECLIHAPVGHRSGGVGNRAAVVLRAGNCLRDQIVKIVIDQLPLPSRYAVKRTVRLTVLRRFVFQKQNCRGDSLGGVFG